MDRRYNSYDPKRMIGDSVVTRKDPETRRSRDPLGFNEFGSLKYEGDEDILTEEFSSEEI